MKSVSSLIMGLAATALAFGIVVGLSDSVHAANPDGYAPQAMNSAQTGNPYAPNYGHRYRHGAIPTRATWVLMKQWRASQTAHAATTAGSSKTLTYGGGTSSSSQGTVGVMNGKVKVYLVFYGSGWGTQSTDSNGDATFSGDPDGAAPVAQELFKDIGTGGETWSADLTQWCQGISSGSTSCPNTTAASDFVPYQSGGILAGVWEDTSATSPIKATATQLAKEAIAAANHFGNTTAASNRYAYYVIMSATGDDPDNWTNPTNGYCAWHDWTGDYSVTSSVGDLAFSNQPYDPDAGSSCGAGMVNSPGKLDGWTMAIGHEWHEMMSDTYPSGGWTASDGSENSDECAYISSGQGAVANVTMGTGTFAMQSSWSNDTNECDMTHAILSHGSPVANDGAVTTTQDTAVSGTLSATDSTSTTLTYAVVTNPANGSVSITDSSTGAFTYTPNSGYTGSDSFTFTATDSSGNVSNTATESVSVKNPLNASDGRVITTPNTAVNGTLTASDSDGESITFAIAANPSHGTVNITNTSTGTFTYTPNSSYVGSDSFTFTATDSGGNVSNTATESVDVNSVPVATNGSISTTAGGTGSGNLSASDSDGDNLTFTIVGNPGHGTVRITNALTGAFTYRPSVGFLGNDSFTFQVTDSVGNVSNIATESVAVTDTAPTASNASVATQTDTAVAGTLSGSDPDAGQTLTYSIVTKPMQGTVTITNASTGAFTYTPNSGFAGNDSFTFEVNDGYKTSNTATESVTINDIAPTAAAASYQTKTNQAVNGQLQASNPEAGQTLIFTLVSKPNHGAVNINAASGTFTYTPVSGYAGTDSFSFAANDGYLSSNTAAVAITINDTAPTATDSSITTTSNTTAKVVLSASDPDSGQNLTYSIVIQPSHGTLSPVSGSPGSYTYTPASGFVGTDSFTFKANDGYQDSGTATVSLTVNDTAPVASNQTVTTGVNQNVFGTLDATDPDAGQTLTYSIVNKPLHGTVSLTADGSFIYAPDNGFSGTDSFTFEANDGYLNSNVATESIMVQNASQNSGGGSSGGGSLGLLSLLMLSTLSAARNFYRRNAGK